MRRNVSGRIFAFTSSMPKAPICRKFSGTRKMATVGMENRAGVGVPASVAARTEDVPDTGANVQASG